MVSNNIFRHFHQGALPSLKALGQKGKKKVFWNTVDCLHWLLWSPLCVWGVEHCWGIGTLQAGSLPSLKGMTKSGGKGAAGAALLGLNGKVCRLQILTQVVMFSAWTTAPILSSVSLKESVSVAFFTFSPYFCRERYVKYYFAILRWLNIWCQVL